MAFLILHHLTVRGSCMLTSLAMIGFARKMSRAASVPKYLTADLFTANFWPEVDRVTLGILTVLIPMINFSGKLNEALAWPPLAEVYQNLHNIVAEAGWLANGLALSRSCFWIDFPQPGQLCDLRQEHASDVIWTASREAVTRKDDRALTSWLFARNTLHDSTRGADPARDATAAKSVPVAWEAEYMSQKPRPARRTAKVQIVLWPFLERSYPYKQDLVSGDMNSGESTSVVQKAQVVYYSGVDTDAGEQSENYTLRQHIDDYKRAKALFWGPRAFVTWPLLVALLAMVLYAAYKNGHDVSKTLENWKLPQLPPLSWPKWPIGGGGGGDGDGGDSPPVTVTVKTTTTVQQTLRETTTTTVTETQRGTGQKVEASITDPADGRPPLASEGSKPFVTPTAREAAGTGFFRWPFSQRREPFDVLVYADNNAIECISAVDYYSGPEGARRERVPPEDLAHFFSRVTAGKKPPPAKDFMEMRKKPGPQVTGDVKPDAVFTDPARPEVTVDMNKGFWRPLEMEDGQAYACWIKMQMGICFTASSTVVLQSSARSTVVVQPTGA